jgi:hypothetical protein
LEVSGWKEHLSGFAMEFRALLNLAAEFNCDRPRVHVGREPAPISEYRTKYKRPRLGLSHGTFVEQPSPEVCSTTE